MSNNEIIRQIVSEVISKDLGGVTAYAAAVNRGYTGTKEQFETLMASYATVAQQAVDAKEAAETAQGLAEDARDDAVAAKEAAQTANTGAVTAKNAAETAQGKAETAQGKAEDAQEAAESAKDDAVAAKNSVESTASNFASTAAQAVSEVNAAGTNQKNLAQAQAENAQAYAEGKRGSSTVGQSDPAYHNNAKYYSEQAAGGASGAGASALVAEGYAKGTQSGTAVTSDSPYYQDNAAYHKEQAAANASDAEAWANGTRGGEDIESDDPAYGKSAKDYAEEAAASAASLTVDSALSDSSTNPVQNKVVNAAVNSLMEDLTRIEAIIPILAGRGKTWAEIKQNVKMGYGEILYPVGTDFSVDCPTGSPYDSIVWTVVDHRIENGEHIMTLLMKHVIYGLQFDAPQAIIVPDETMAAGTYHFKLLSGYDTTYDGGKSVQFTLANDLAAGGQIVMNWPYNQTWIGKNITVYDEFGTAVIETCVMSEGTGGTDLGDADGTVSILNHTQRARYGSNNYKESAMRDWLNSDNLAGQWQTQQTRFQRPCDYAANRAGFVTYLDPDFVAVIREGTHLNRTNEVFDLNGKKQAYSTTEKFFLPAQEEIGFSSESGIVCGTVFDFYNDAAQSDKIKYDITAQTTARYWWLRTPHPSYAYNERYVLSSGALYNSFAYNGFGASAACEI